MDTVKVEILAPFSVNGPKGDVHYTKGQIVQNGKQSWIDKGLAVKAGTTKPAGAKSAD